MRPDKQTVGTIFLVDDDHTVLASLRALLTLESDHTVSVFTDPHRALDELQRTPADVVISDYLMPGLNGIDLLRQVGLVQPDTARILLTGFADKENAIRAINEVGLFQYIEKPWDNDQILVVVRNALQQTSLRRQLTGKLAELDELMRDHAELSARHDHLERELKMAEHVQRGLLPTAIPSIQGFRVQSLYRPCRLLGGDYFDVAVREGGAILLVADVSGHGAQAALTSMLLKASFQDAAASAAGLPELLATMNATLYQFLPPSTFVAAAAVQLREGDSSLLLANAGLPRPFIVRGDGPVDTVLAEGVPLGLFAGAGIEPYQTREVGLMSGDILLIASDGLSEATNGQGEQFGDARLALAVGETTSLDALFSTMQDFCGTEAITDDVTIVSVEKV